MGDDLGDGDFDFTFRTREVNDDDNADGGGDSSETKLKKKKKKKRSLADTADKSGDEETNDPLGHSSSQSKKLKLQITKDSVVASISPNDIVGQFMAAYRKQVWIELLAKSAFLLSSLKSRNFSKCYVARQLQGKVTPAELEFGGELCIAQIIAPTREVMTARATFCFFYLNY
jgi:hypothetical protein